MSELSELPSWSGQALEGQAAVPGQQGPHHQAGPPGDQGGGRRSGLMLGLLVGLLSGLVLAGVGIGAYWLGSRQGDQPDGGQVAATDEGADTTDPSAGDGTGAADADGTATDDQVASPTTTPPTTTAEAAGDDGDAAADDPGLPAAGEVGAADGELVLPEGFIPSDPNYEARIQQTTEYAVVRGGKVYLYGFSPDQDALDLSIAVTEAVMGPDGYVVERFVDPDAADGGTGQIFVDDKVLFDFNSTELAPDSLPILDLGALLMLQNPTAEMVIIARSDAVGSEETNLEVSRRRGEAVVDYWASQGVERERMTVDARGEADASESDNDEMAALNRSVEFVVSGIDPPG